ncbi:MAG: LPS translocon maturation chaperone LptM [Caulobacterales bacterium]|uniref:LPS translocon maturation chaperone LptM n=1 Tax=Glycocaulis sp. TaxID=1969725 RepID=UPI003F9EFD14
MTSRILLLAILVSAFTLAGCGNRGALDRPGPLWGEPQDAVTDEADGSADEDVLVDERPSQRLPSMPGDDPFEDD